MASPATLSTHVANYADIPKRLQPLYTMSADDGYELTGAGRALASYRAALAKEHIGEPITPLRTLSKQEWMTLVAVAQPGEERQHFLRAAALKRIRVEG